MGAQLVPVPIFGGSYNDDTRPYDQQDMVNYLPEPAENPNARSQGILRGVPGLTRKIRLGDDPIRGIHNVEGRLFIVEGATLWEVSTAFVATSRGTISGTGRVAMEHNQANQMWVFNGPQGWVLDLTANTLTQITDDGFPGSSSTAYIDTYTLGVDPLGNYFFNSDPGNALSYDTTEQYAAESAPDNIISLIVIHSEVWVAGSRTIQIFRDAGAADGTFATQPGLTIEKGVSGPYAMCRLDNTIYWLGNDGIFYNAGAGYNAQRVSTHAIEQDISALDWSQVRLMTWVDRGHSVMYATFPDGHTWGFDVSSRLWHRRESFGLNRWRVDFLEYWNGMWIAGDFTDGRVYALDWSNFQEDGQPLVATRRFPWISSNANRMFLTWIEMLMDTGHGPVGGDAYINIRYSDNGYDYSSYRQKSIGDVNNKGMRVRWSRWGSFYGRVYEVSVSSNVKRDIVAAYASLK